MSELAPSQPTDQDAQVTNITAQRDARREVAEATIAAIDVSWIESPDFNPNSSVPMPEFVDGIIGYWAHPDTHLYAGNMQSSAFQPWLPNALKGNRSVVKYFGAIKFDYPGVETIVDTDPIVTGFEKELQNLREYIPQSQTAQTWRAFIVACRRIRIDELEIYAQDRALPQFESMDELAPELATSTWFEHWRQIIVKLDEEKPREF